MPQRPRVGQTDKSILKNISFFRDNVHSYGQNVQQLDTYAAIRASIGDVVKGISRLLDIGNGGVFDYDVDAVSSIVALDLFLGKIDTSSYPPHIKFKTGSAVDIPERNESFDGVIMVMLLHHLVGKSVGESLGNVRVAIQEALRVLRPGGKLIIVESCVPTWFYLFERAVFPVASRLINAVLSHPATLQYPVNIIAEMSGAATSQIEIFRIPKGRWVLQYGYRFPSILTPISVYRLVIQKSG
jgi:SAM-dependent methyltransferase